MSDGCAHVPPRNLPGYEVESFTSGPSSTATSCTVGPECDHSHVFVVRNFHLYDVNISVDVSATARGVEICNLGEDPEKRVQWTITGRIPAAPYRPNGRAARYGSRRVSAKVRDTGNGNEKSDVLSIEYSIDSPVNGIMTGLPFNIPVILI